MFVENPVCGCPQSRRGGHRDPPQMAAAACTPATPATPPTGGAACWKTSGPAPGTGAFLRDDGNAPAPGTPISTLTNQGSVLTIHKGPTQGWIVVWRVGRLVSAAYCFFSPAPAISFWTNSPSRVCVCVSRCREERLRQEPRGGRQEAQGKGGLGRRAARVWGGSQDTRPRSPQPLFPPWKRVSLTDPRGVI